MRADIFLQSMGPIEITFSEPPSALWWKIRLVSRNISPITNAFELADIAYSKIVNSPLFKVMITHSFMHNILFLYLYLTI